MTSSSKDIITLLMKHGATREQAASILDEVAKVPFSAPQNPDKWRRARERAFHMAQWAIEKAKEYGRQNAETSI